MSTTVGIARDMFLVPVADVFIPLFNDNGTNKQSQIKTNLASTLCEVLAYTVERIGASASSG
jgi:hypothetical protein